MPINTESENKKAGTIIINTKCSYCIKTYAAAPRKNVQAWVRSNVGRLVSENRGDLLTIFELRTLKGEWRLLPKLPGCRNFSHMLSLYNEKIKVIEECVAQF